MFRATLLLLVSSVTLPAQDATSLGQAVAAYTDLYTLCIRQHKHLDADVIAKVLASLKRHFSEYPEAFMKAGDFYLELGDSDRAIHEYQEGIADRQRPQNQHLPETHRRIIHPAKRKPLRPAT